MKKGSLMFIPAGGLANRMKAVSAAVRLAREAQSDLQVVWFQDWGLGCRYDQLFCPLALPGGHGVREATLRDLLTRDRPRRRNLYLPWLWERARYDLRINEREATRRNLAGLDFTECCRGRRVWLSSHIYFMSLAIPEDAFDMFRPVPLLAREIARRRQQLGSNVVGVHIRRTDNAASIRQSPTELFIDRMRREPSDTRFLLATDSEQEKATLRRHFGNRLVTADREAERGTVLGMQDALIDLYLLSSTRLIIGSAASTYSTTAAAIGRTPLELVRRT